jgi:ribosomal protein S27E
LGRHGDDREDLTVECPNCGTIYCDWRRASVNASLDPEIASDADYMEQCSSVRCPACGTKVRFDVLIADRDGGFHAHYYSPPDGRRRKR